MEEILTIAQTISPIGIIAILVIIIYQLIDGRGMLGKIFGNSEKIKGTQEAKYPELEKHLLYLEESYENQRAFQENHSMHEIPEMRNGIIRIEKAVENLTEVQREQGLDIARLKGLLEK